MLHYDHPDIRPLLFSGGFGLEKESLRVDENGLLSQTDHPFPDDEHIVRDFSENQTEINTSVCHSAQEAINELSCHYLRIQKKLFEMSPREYLWPFSNPPYIRSEKDIPVARFSGDQASKTVYRDYLANRYGRYIMTFSGIHVNFSFDDELLKRDYALCEKDRYQDFSDYKNRFYLTLAERAASYGWILTAATAASPIMDSSYVEKGILGEDTFFNGMASLRSSEFGYWNFFAPILDYTSIEAYVGSIQRYVNEGFLASPSELYYPIRLKSKGVYSMEGLLENGVSHIELRMFDLNPLIPVGLDVRDVEFAQYLLIWLISTPHRHLSPSAQVQAAHNFKIAAHYDLKTVRILLQNGDMYGDAYPVADAALAVIATMKDFFRNADSHVQDILDFQADKFTNPHNRYAWKVRRLYQDGFVKKGLLLARQRQEEALNCSAEHACRSV